MKILNTEFFVKFCAFTLAEVLITLGIIGVVAVMTMPSLINNYKTKSFQTAKKVFLAKLEDTTKRMNLANELVGYSTTEEFFEAMQKYIKLSKNCINTDHSNCFPKNIQVGQDDALEKFDIDDLITSRNLGVDYTSNVISGVLLNGTSIVLSYNPNCTYLDPYDNQLDTTQCIAMLYDINGFAEPNQQGKDIYTLHTGNIFGAYYKLPSGLRVDLEDTEPLAINPSDPKYREYVSQVNGNICMWHDYYDNTGACSVDYLVGAALACQEKGMRLPNELEMNEIAAFIYNNDKCVGKQYDLGTYCKTTLNGTLNNDILNITLDNNGYIINYWINSGYTAENSSEVIKGVRFSSTENTGYSGYRYHKRNVRCVY